MSRFPRLRRRPDHWRDAHERAQVRAAERLDGPLGLTETAWLDEHLAGCPSCAAIAAAYAADREALQSLRQDAPEPPRDLWARTAAAIEQLSLDGGVPVQKLADEPARRRGRLGGLPLGAISTVAVVVIVVGASVVSRGITQQTAGTSPAASVGAAEASHRPSPALPGAEATPFAVGAAAVQVVDGGPGGVGYSTYQVEQVCPEEGSSNCSAIPEKAATALGLTNTPRTVIGSPSRRQAVAISKTPDAGDQVVIVQLPETEPAASPSPTPARTEPPTPPPSADASATPSDGAEPTDGATPTVVIQSAPPSATPLATPSATAAKNLAIASGIEVVGESAAYSADGGWFAFTARPGDGSGGPDVYIWRVGDARAERLTTDHSSYFASWSGNRAIVSRPADREARTTDAVSVAIDPVSRDERSVGAVWRPMVDPSGHFAIAWDGTLDRTDGPLAWHPAEGRLALRTWSDGRDGGTPNGSDDRRVVADEARGDFDVRWDETGEWAAIWVGNDSETATGRLTLVHLDESKDRFEHIKGAPEDLPAMPGFSIASGRLAWATPRGQGGEGSRVQIAAWSGNGVGIVASGPGEDVVVIR